MTFPSLSEFHFPSYTKDTLSDHINVYWYDKDFSQSRYPPGQEKSEACTLICLLVAQGICQTGLLVSSMETCLEFTINIANAMVHGNTTHSWIMKKGLVSHPYLNTEEALKLGGISLNLLNEWKFRVYHERIQRNLYQNINSFLHEWYASPKSKNLFMLLITCGRTVLFIFQERTYMVTFFDSHSHSTIEAPHRGLVVAQASINKLESLCSWYIEEILNKCYNTEAHQYELAFLYPNGPPRCGCNCSRNNIKN